MKLIFNHESSDIGLTASAYCASNLQRLLGACNQVAKLVFQFHFLGATRGQVYAQR